MNRISLSRRSRRGLVALAACGTVSETVSGPKLTAMNVPQVERIMQVNFLGVVYAVEAVLPGFEVFQAGGDFADGIHAVVDVERRQALGAAAEIGDSLADLARSGGVGVQGGVAHVVVSVNGRRPTKGVDSPPPRVGPAPPIARCPRARPGATVELPS